VYLRLRAGGQKLFFLTRKKTLEKKEQFPSMLARSGTV